MKITQDDIKYVIVQAGGKGTRRGHYAENRPKCLVPVNDIPMIMNTLKVYKDKDVIIIVDLLADVLIPYSELDHAAVSWQGYNFADDFKVYLDAHIFYFMERDTLQIKNLDDTFYYFKRYIDKYENCTLGEVKISKQTAEDVLQHINQYHEFVNPTQTFICLDYEDTQLKNLTKNSKIEVVKLGPKFIEFCENRPEEKIEEI